ncbi:M1 family metallopeptidase [Nocardioides lianchengensis]|uniref:Aminopeptidase N n=1 Tax=Nocardioides lianchengensis TaxID=1045774 RepID=A0A1G6KYH1_9ACTN|nr:M1 family metallopeptidase [Nocardioides lianchengensis]NYG13728.1 aminopeptidase N [Nocardioides lianchengensis]SDC35535.1 Peptidase family M1 [Nocardioides lianchengensis]
MTARVRLAAGAAALTALAVLAGGCSDGTWEGEADQDPTSSSEPTTGTDTDTGTDDTPEADLDLALSEPVEDPLYPEVGDPGVDALHYDLTLDWDPATSVLTGEEVLTFRATATAERFQLDLGEPLEVGDVLLDGEPVEVEHDGKDLVVLAPVEEDARHELTLSYAGTPTPAPAPTQRSDFSTTGWTITDDGETWTMQEPFGAYTWYAVNDQPSDKALYDFTITVPSPWSGVANGELLSRTDADGVTETRWHLAEPAASYLVTVATGDFTMTEDESASGVPITYWTPSDEPEYIEKLQETPAGLAWLEERLGPYPFDTLGIVIVDSESGMETQTMITLGDTEYATSPAVLVHEMAHHWYGDQVTPRDWRDVWMNEGMAMYLQGAWEADDAGVPVTDVMDEWAPYEEDFRAESGPPADFDPDQFGASNIYYGPALMWQEVRERIGEERFWSMVRAWPAARDNLSTGREDYLAWVEEETGEELTDLFDAWLLGETTPPRD